MHDAILKTSNGRQRLWTCFCACFGQRACLILAILLFLVKCALFYMFFSQTPFRFYSYFGKFGKQEPFKEQVNVVMVACGKVEYLPTLLKTVLLFGQDERIQLNLILLTDNKSLLPLNETLTNLTYEAREHLNGLNFTYELHPTWFPSDNGTGINWRSMFKPCSTQRLFFTSILKHIDSIIYLDQDCLVLGNLLEIWRAFSRMDAHQMIALSYDSSKIYNPNKGHPYVEPIGVNGGVLLMNLTRLREFEFERRAVEEYKKWPRLRYADQDLINIIFHENPDKILVLPCSHNICSPRCLETQGCAGVPGNGVLVVHGAGGAFKSTKSYLKALPWIYHVFKNYTLGDSELQLLDKMYNEYSALDPQCGYITPANFTQNAAAYFQVLQQQRGAGLLK